MSQSISLGLAEIKFNILKEFVLVIIRMVTSLLVNVTNISWLKLKKG